MKTEKSYELKIIENSNFTDIVVYNVGSEQRPPASGYGPAVRQHFLIHYVLGGKGVFDDGQNRFPVKKGQAFIIYPGESTYYESDKDDPWRYVWIEFDGLRAKDYLQKSGFSHENPVYSAKDYTVLPAQYLLDIFDEPNNSIRSMGLTYLFFDKLIGCSVVNTEPPPTVFNDVYIDMVIHHISIHYDKTIHVQELADICNISRSHFFKIFKKKMGVCPRKFLVAYKIEHACELLKSSDLTIGDIARMIGYDDQLAFSKMFKKLKSVSPADYRRRLSVRTGL